MKNFPGILNALYFVLDGRATKCALFKNAELHFMIGIIQERYEILQFLFKLFLIKHFFFVLYPTTVYNTTMAKLCTLHKT